MASACIVVDPAAQTEVAAGRSGQRRQTASWWCLYATLVFCPLESRTCWTESDWEGESYRPCRKVVVATWLNEAECWCTDVGHARSTTTSNRGSVGLNWSRLLSVGRGCRGQLHAIQLHRLGCAILGWSSNPEWLGWAVGADTQNNRDAGSRRRRGWDRWVCGGALSRAQCRSRSVGADAIRCVGVKAVIVSVVRDSIGRCLLEHVVGLAG